MTDCPNGCQDPRHNPEVTFRSSLALARARQGDLFGGMVEVHDLHDAFGPEAVWAMILMLCDTLLISQGIDPTQPDSRPCRPKWLDPATGQGMDADQAEPVCRWVGQLVSARANRDDAGFDALMAIIEPDPQRTESHVAALLSSVAALLNRFDAESAAAGRLAGLQ
jgi:hypothetical protein